MAPSSTVVSGGVPGIVTTIQSRTNWDIKSKRFLLLLLVNLLWASVGFMAGQWAIFEAMIWPMTTLNGGYIISETWRPTGMPTIGG